MSTLTLPATASPGVSYPTARITDIKPISCEGLSGSTPGATSARCADVTARLLQGDDKGQAVTVPMTAAIYASGVKVGQVIKLVRIPPLDGSAGAVPVLRLRAAVRRCS